MIQLFDKNDFKDFLGDSYEDMQISGVNVDELFESFSCPITGTYKLNYHDLEKIINLVRTLARKVVLEDTIPGGLK